MTCIHCFKSIKVVKKINADEETHELYSKIKHYGQRCNNGRPTLVGAVLTLHLNVNYFSTLTNIYSGSQLTCIYSGNKKKYVDIKSRPTLLSILAMCTIWTWSNAGVV